MYQCIYFADYSFKDKDKDDKGGTRELMTPLAAAASFNFLPPSHFPPHPPSTRLFDLIWKQVTPYHTPYKANPLVGRVEPVDYPVYWLNQTLSVMGWSKGRVHRPRDRFGSGLVG